MRYLVPALATLLVVACGQPRPTDDTAAAQSGADGNTGTMPARTNFTPFDDIMLVGRCSNDECLANEEYYTWQIKASFDIDAKGRLKISPRQEVSLAQQDDPENDYKCGPKDGTFNQRTTWFPYTAIFVRGGKLQSVRKSDGEQQELLPMSPVEQGLMMVVGSIARKVEYAYVPCVGKYRVTAGHRLSSFLPRNAVMTIKPAKGPLMRLSLPEPTEPYVLLQYKSGAMAPIPMRVTMLSVDLIERRVTAHFRTTIPISPPLANMELRAFLPNQMPGVGETMERLQERRTATLDYLRQCPAALRPMEPCASPTVKPDPKIFSP